MTEKQIVYSMFKLLKVPEIAITPWLSVALGSSWIIDKKLPLSEIELSMTLKSLRKLITVKKKDLIISTTDDKEKCSVCSSIFSSYAAFNALHQSYYETHEGLQNINSFLSHDAVFDMGLPKTRFFTLLPIVLSAINPFELETMFALNSIYRLLIAEEIALQMKRKFFIRGSLLLFHARPFGIGYNANFLGIDANKTKQTIYNQATGSDVDIRLKDETDLQQSKQQIQQYQKDYPDTIIEVAKQQKKSNDFVIDVSQVRVLIDLYLTSPVHVFIKPIPIELKSLTEIRHAKQQHKTTPALITLTDDTRYKLYNSFCHILKANNANDETIRILGAQFLELLSKAKMETDFYCRIKKTILWETFKTVFQFSGYRFDTSEMRTLFINLLNQATS